MPPIRLGIKKTVLKRLVPRIPRVSSRASKNVFLRPEQVTPEAIANAQRLGAIAAERGQSLAQMAIAWLLAKNVTSVIVGASTVAQLEDNINAIHNITFSEEELRAIESIKWA